MTITGGDVVNSCISIAAISSAVLVFFLEQRREVERERIEIANGTSVVDIFPPHFRIIIRRMYGLLPQLTLNSQRDARISAFIDLSAIIIFFSLLVAFVTLLTPDNYLIGVEILFLSLITVLGSLVGGIIIWSYRRGE